MGMGTNWPPGSKYMVFHVLNLSTCLKHLLLTEFANRKLLVERTVATTAKYTDIFSLRKHLLKYRLEGNPKFKGTKHINK